MPASVAKRASRRGFWRSGARFSLDAKALQHAADYLHNTQQIDKKFDTSKILQLR